MSKLTFTVEYTIDSPYEYDEELRLALDFTLEEYVTWLVKYGYMHRTARFNTRYTIQDIKRGEETA